MHEAEGSSQSALRLGVPGFSYADLHTAPGLRRLYDVFVREVQAGDPTLWAEWDVYQSAPDAPRRPTEISDLLVRMAPHVSRFVAALFGVQAEAAALAKATRDDDPIFRFKVEFVRRRALPLLKTGQAPHVSAADRERVHGLLDANTDEDCELALARAGCALLDREGETEVGLPERAEVAVALLALQRWCAARIHDPEYRTWTLFRFPETIDYARLVRVDHDDPALPQKMVGPSPTLRRRDGFGLTDARMTVREALGEVHYCILCHERDKDSCSKGLRGKDGQATVNPLGSALEGCPLDEKISEMHALRKIGDVLGALALVILDNPMCPGTGHRICNDCMKACIYQKQEPVNIPQVETSVLTQALRMPWGVEMYGLLTRWNPLNVRRPYALPYNGKNVLVVGLGPAGYTLAHYLLNEGFGVVGVDGLKIEPMPERLVGGDGCAMEPIREWDEIYRSLDERILEGFGGVSEYGITVRWDKNFLTLIHLTLARRDHLRVHGGIRFGGTITVDEAWAHGFHHAAIAAGAGKPTIIDMKNNLIRGIRKASDFLMALQLTGAFKRDALTNLQVRLPAVVIGGGLTGVDSATELMAYYPVQVERMLEQYESLVRALGEGGVRAIYDEEERDVLDEFLAHGRAVRDERRRAAEAGERPNFVHLVRSWGGVSLVYRKRLHDSPAYRLNHEEVSKALEEGIAFVENLDPVEAVPDAYGAVAAIRFRQVGAATSGDAADLVELPARTVLVAAGTSPNVTSEKESPGTFQLDGRQRYFQLHRAAREADGTFRLEPAPDGFFTSYNEGGRLVSYYGDNHPRYAGNVVKAMASAKHGYPHVVGLFADELAALDPADQPSREQAWTDLATRLDDELSARVEDVRRLTPNIVEVIVRAPAAARRFQPGQFYRLQNYERIAPHVELAGRRTHLMMEGLALTGAWVDPEKGLLSLIALEMGVSSRLCAFLKRGEPVVLMGPTGTPTEIPEGQSVLLAGGGLGNAVLFSIAKALKSRGNRVVYFAGYKRGEDLFKREEIEASTDQIIWATDTGAPITPSRPQDRHIRGNIVQAMTAYAQGALGEQRVPMPEVDHIIVIGSDRMMAAVKELRRGALAPWLKPHHTAIASINSPMQCMMKEICAQCLQKHIDPVTGEESVVFTCFNQDQPMDCVDFTHLASRLRQNTVQEKMASLWLDQLLGQAELARI